MEVGSGRGRDFVRGLEARAPLAALWDLDARFRAMDEVEEPYVQILTICTPPIEEIAEGQLGADLARFTNDQMAELVARYPDRFKGFAASLCMTEVDASLTEIDRCVNDLGALGIQIFTNVKGRSMDEPRFAPIFDRMAALDRSIWVHGWRSPSIPDYEGDDFSRFGLWLSLGWPYEMGMFMSRISISGVFDRHPNLRIFAHHSGGMIASFGRRVGPGMSAFVPEGLASDMETFGKLEKMTFDYLKMFYVDTTGQTPITIEAAMKFFGLERMMMGTDFPWMYPKPHLTNLDQLGLTADQRQQLLAQNAQRILGIKV